VARRLLGFDLVAAFVLKDGVVISDFKLQNSQSALLLYSRYTWAFIHTSITG